MSRTIFLSLLLGALAGAPVRASAYERVPPEVVRALGTTRGKAVSTGLVFIDGKFIRAPYRVTRAGNQILINDRPVTGQVVPWTKFLETQDPSNLTETEVAEPDETPASGRAPQPAADGVDPAAPKDGGNAPATSLDDLFSQVRVRIVETRLAAGSGDAGGADAPEKMRLSDIPADTEEDEARQQRGEESRKAKEAEARAAKEEEESDESESGDQEDGKSGEGDRQGGDASAGGESGEEVDPASPEGEAAAKAKAAAAAAAKAKAAVAPVAASAPSGRTRKALALAGKFVPNAQARGLVRKVDERRTQMERVLRRGGFLFIGTGPKRYLKGAMSDSVWTKELLKKLPELMAAARDAESFCDAVQSSGLMSYVNLQIARDLFRNRMDAFYLKQRRREIADEDKLRKMMNNGR